MNYNTPLPDGAIDTGVSPSAEGKYSLDLLDRYYKEAAENDSQAFREMRQCIRLHTGKHLSGGSDSAGPYESRANSNELKIVVNHIPRIAGVYLNEILSHAPDIFVTVKDEGDIRASRLAKMNKYVWEEHKKKSRLYEEKMRLEILNGIITGEIAVKLYWDNEKNWVKEEPILPFDLLRAPGITDIGDSPWYIHRKIYREEELRKMYGPQIGSALADEGSNTIENTDFLVFSTQDKEYSEFRGVEIREFYLRPNSEHPRGYYVFFMRDRILEQGELPGGLFPIVIRRLQSSLMLPRGYSFIRTVTATQMEINRAMSQDANNMYHFGGDKIVTSARSALSVGESFHGTNHLKVSSYGPLKDSFLYVEGSGMPKYMDYVSNLIKQMDYQVNLQTKLEEKKDARSGDISFVLYSRIRDKERFATLGTNYEGYLKEKAESVLSLLRFYLGPNDFIPQGHAEDKVLIEDFRNTSDLDYTFSVDVVSGSAEDVFSKQMLIQSTMQYLGKDFLSRTDIGMMMAHTSLANDKGFIANLTSDHDAVVNDMINIEKGIMPRITDTMNFKYKMEKITARTNRPDFQFLWPETQQMYEQFLQMCGQKMAEIQEEELRLEKNFIPMDGPVTKIDMLHNMPNAEGKVKQERMTLPVKAVNWLVGVLAKQSQVKDQIQGLSPDTQNDIIGQMPPIDQQLEVGGGGQLAGTPGQISGGGSEQLPPPL